MPQKTPREAPPAVAFCDGTRPNRSGRYVAFCDDTRPNRSGRYVAFCDKAAFFALSFFVFFLPIYNAYASLGLGVAVFFSLLKHILSWKKQPRPVTNDVCNGINAPVILLCAIAILTLAVSTNRTETLTGLRKLSLHVFLYLAVVNSINTKKRLRWFIFLFLFSASVVALDGFYQYARREDWFSGRPLMRYPNRGIVRVTASFLQAGSLGIYLGAAVPVAAGLVLYHLRGARRLIGIAVLIALLGALTLTLAPGAGLGVCAAAALFAVLKRKHRLFIFVILIAGLLAGAFFLPNSITRWPDGSLFETFLGRLQMWQIGLKIVTGHPLLGVGWHNFPENYKQLCATGYPFCEREGTPYAHNMYLQIAAEAGLMGLLAFLWILVRAFRQLRACLKNNHDDFLAALSLGLMGALTAYLTHGLLESCLQTSHGALLFWFLLGLIAALNNISHPSKNIDRMTNPC